LIDDSSLSSLSLHGLFALLLLMLVGSVRSSSIPHFYVVHVVHFVSYILLLKPTEPWMHVFMFSAGCYVGNKYPKAEAKLVQDVNALRASHGMPPLVGSNAWIRFQPPVDN
jgi:hypothetical protein